MQQNHSGEDYISASMGLRSNAANLYEHDGRKQLLRHEIIKEKYCQRPMRSNVSCDYNIPNNCSAMKQFSNVLVIVSYPYREIGNSYARQFEHSFES